MMHIFRWQTTFTTCLILALAGCQTSSGIGDVVASLNRQSGGFKQKSTSESEDGFTASKQIRADWRKQNLASLYQTDSSSVAESEIAKEPVFMQAAFDSSEAVPLFPDDETGAFVEVHDGNSSVDDLSENTVVPALSEITESIVAEESAIETGAASTETTLVSSEAYPVDLPTILRLAGGHNWAVQLAWERINQAEANVDAAEVLWVPSLNVGIGATKHDGRIQATNGQIVDVSRNSLFIGGGAKVANAPMAGGAGGPARLAVDLSIADALFQPLVARQLSCAARSRHAVEFNNAQLDGALAYFDLVAAQGEITIADANLKDAHNLLAITEAFAAAGKTSSAEVARVNVTVLNQQQARINSELKLKLASSELIRIVRLDPAQLTSDALLYSADDHLMPLELIPESSDLSSLIAQGQRARPEVAERYALAEAQRANARSQKLRPFIPHVNLGMSAGVFGGGVGSNIAGLDGRSDLDAMLVWEVRNLGLGEQAARRESSSRYRQTVLSAHQVQDQIAADVRNAWHRIDAGRQQIVLARSNVNAAGRVLEMNLERIRGLEGLPLEAIQALNSVSSARLNLLQSIVDYNKAQASLLRAVGRPVSHAL
jgi:outer membrane protein TolC